MLAGQAEGREVVTVEGLAEAEGFPDLVAESASHIDDVRGTAAYRRHALRVLARRALDRCLS